MQTSVLKRFDVLLSPPACWLGAFFPKQNPRPTDKALILRPGEMGELIGADIALQTLGLNAADYMWVISTRARPWARLRKLPHVCYDEKWREGLSRVMGRFALVINTEQRYGLAEAYALGSRSKRARVASFAANRGASWSNERVAYDRKEAHEAREFARLFAAAFLLPEPIGDLVKRARVVPADAPPLVMIAGQENPARRLSAETWAKEISEWHRGRAFLIGGAAGDAALISDLVARFGGLATKFAGTFEDVCAQISRSEEVLSMDGGAVQIASFYGVPTLALFTESARERKWKPLGEGSRSKVVEI